MDILTSVSNGTISETELFSTLIQKATTQDLPFALWRLPNASVKRFLISNDHRQLAKETVIEDLNAGFIFAPFDRNMNAIFLPADYIFSVENGKLKQPETSEEINSIAWLEKQSGPDDPRQTSAAKETQTHSPHQEDYIALVNRCLEEIAKGTVEKIVPSRTKTITLPHDFDILNAFEKLCERYSNTLVSYVSIPGIGSWLGASPELLVCVEDKTIFKTMALAGTMPFQEGINLKSVAWTQKEIEEQALVERYIISCFKKIRLREYDEQGPKTVVAGNLMHLRSDFTVNMKDTNFPQLGTVMLQLLHPTSAVCGMPLDASFEFLKKNEGYDRAFYSGYLGPINIDANIHIFVNLRCMQIQDKQAVLYAGAGVTIDSIPEKEFAETEIKFDTLLNVVL